MRNSAWLKTDRCALERRLKSKIPLSTKDILRKEIGPPSLYFKEI